MRLPVFIKAIIGCTDTESSRYSLGGVRCESADNVSLITVTDGRKLLNVSYGDECDPVDCIIEAKPLTKAYAAASVKGRNTVFEVVDGKALVVGGAGAATAPLLDGKFPRWRDVFGDTSAHKQIGVKPELLIDVLSVFKAAAVEGVRVYVGDAESAIYFAGTAPTGEVIRAVLMPMSIDAAPFPGEFAAESAAEPEQIDETDDEPAAV
jgi:DNA polymerase III sliding clamp (beta) subunit (PCNA family)